MTRESLFEGNFYDLPALVRDSAGGGEDRMEDVELALRSLVGKTLVSATVDADASVDRWLLTLKADDGTVVVLATQDADDYQSWLEVVS